MDLFANDDVKIYVPRIKNPGDIIAEENDTSDCVKIYPENKKSVHIEIMQTD